MRRGRWWRAAVAVGAAGAVLALSACSTAKPWVNVPLTEPPAQAQPLPAERDPSLLVAVTLSGGGARAAAFGYGVLSALRESEFVWDGHRQNLLGATDVISGVSGGSIIAAYYAVHGEEGLPRFEDEYLRKDFQRGLINLALLPASMVELSSPWYGRSHLLARRLDALYGGVTFGDLERESDRPQLVVTATDLSRGQGFEFSWDQFRQICSDLRSVPVSFAVAASSAVPLVLSPLTLRNHADRCPPPLLEGAPPGAAPALGSAGAGAVAQESAGGGSGPAADSAELEGVSERVTASAGADSAGIAAGLTPRLEATPAHRTDGLNDTSYRARLYRQHAQSYADAEQRPYIHLVDGGISDNLGVQRLLDRSLSDGGLRASMKSMRLEAGAIRKLVLVVVNSERDPAENIDQQDRLPGMFQVMDQLLFGAGARATQETQELLLDITQQWRRELANAGRDGGDAFSKSAQVHVITVNLRDVPQLQMRQRLLQVATAFTVGDDEVTALIDAGRQVLLHSPEYQALMRSLNRP